MKTSDKSMNNIGLLKLLLLIFIPAILSTTIYIIIGLSQNAIPSLLLFFLCALFFLFPIELGVIMCASKKEYGRYSLKSSFSHHIKMNRLNIILYGTTLFAFSGIVFVIIAPLENNLFAPISTRLAQIAPDYFNWHNVEYLKQYSYNTILLTCASYFVLNVIVGPITEELFFRGFLTSKISRFGNYAPLIITILFSLCHLWLPFNNIFRIFVFFPAAFIAWKQKNIYISIVFHCLCNLFTTVSFFISV